MFERYTERARRVLFFARYEASHLGSISIDTEHLLLGLIREGKGLTSRLFARAGVSLDALRTAIEQQVEFQERVPTSAEIPFTPAAKRVLQASATEADRLLHNYIGTEHLLLGLLSDTASVAGRVLTAHGLRLPVVRDQIVEVLNEPAPDDSDTQASEDRRPADEREDVRLGLSRLLGVPPHRIEAPEELRLPLAIVRERRPAEVYVLTCVTGRSPSAHIDTKSAGAGVSFGTMEFSTASSRSPRTPLMARLHTLGSLTISGISMSDLADMLEGVLLTVVMDETGLEGRYDINVAGPHRSLEAFLSALKDYAGLELTRATREVEMVVVRCG